MQVLLMTMILAGMATMLLRASLSRTVSARKTRRAASATVLIEACMAEVNAIWATKKPEAYLRDLDDKIIYCKNGTTTTDAQGKKHCADANKESTYTCEITSDGFTYQVQASFDDAGNIVYTIPSGNGGLVL